MVVCCECDKLHHPMPVLIVLARDSNGGNLFTLEEPLLRARNAQDRGWHKAGSKPEPLVQGLDEKK